MESWQAHGVQIFALVVALVAVGNGAAYIYSSKKRKGCLDPENFREFKLVERKQLSHNVAKFRFALLSPTSSPGLPAGQHISFRILETLFCYYSLTGANSGFSKAGDKEIARKGILCRAGDLKRPEEAQVLYLYLHAAISFITTQFFMDFELSTMSVGTPAARFRAL